MLVPMNMLWNPSLCFFLLGIMVGKLLTSIQRESRVFFTDIYLFVSKLMTVWNTLIFIVQRFRANGSFFFLVQKTD